MADLRTYQPSFTGGELSPALWARVDLAKYPTGLKLARNVFLHPHGGVSNRAGLEFIGEAGNQASQIKLIPFQFNADQTYILEFGNGYIRVYRDGKVILSGGTPYSIPSPYASSAVHDLVYTQEADVMYLTHVAHPPQRLSRFADNDWRLETATFMPTNSPPATINAAPGVIPKPDDDFTLRPYRYKVSSVADDGEESLPSEESSCVNDLTVAGCTNVINWSPVDGAARYIVYKYDGGSFGYIGGSDGLTFTDENVTADLADSPQKGYNPFIGEGNYPRCSTFVDQRLAFASTLNEPQACWLSQTGNYENFGFSRPRKASDGFEFRIRSRQVNEIRSLLNSRGLMILTSGGEFVATNGENAGPTPDQTVVKPQSYRGASKIQPIVVGSTVLFAQQRGGVVRDFSYEFSEDSFVGKDLTILARHLFEGREITAWAYAQAPNSIVWVVLNDGSLVSLTYIKEHEVWGWTRHQTDGAFEDVTVIAEGGEDTPYFIVRRSVGGATKRYIERLHTRSFSSVEDAFFVDAGLTYAGAAATTITGLSHLEGKAVVALANGNVVRGLTVSNGRIVLPNPATKVHIGLPYEATIQTLDLDLGQVPGLGTVQGRKKSISEVTLRVERTRGIWVGPKESQDKLVEFKQRQSEAWNEAIRLLTGDIQMTPNWDWTNGGNMFVRQFDPLPFTILAIAPDVSVGR